MNGVVGGLDEIGAERESSPELLHPPSQVLIVDYGAQYRDLIRWQVIQQGLRVDIIPAGDEPLDADAIKDKYQAVILSGSNKSVTEENVPPLPEALRDGSIPVLGICFGAQLLAASAGGEVGKVATEQDTRGEFGATGITVDPQSVAFKGMGAATNVLMSHGDSILKIPKGFHQIADSNGIVAAFESDDGRVLGTQFHPEVNETVKGNEILHRFLVETTGIEPDPAYNETVALNEYLDEQEAKIEEILESGGEITGLISGGVDSSVAAAMAISVAKRLGRLNQISLYFIDNGLMRVVDRDVVNLLATGDIHVQVLKMADYFFNHDIQLIDEETGEYYTPEPLSQTSDPQLKRKLIGKGFLDAQEMIIKDRRQHRQARQYFLWGTNAADFVESGGHGGDVIKSHHNVTPETDALREEGLLIEPLLGLFKKHVRRAGRDRYDLPNEIVERQAFPGPGFGPRMVVNPTGELNIPPNFEELQGRLDTMMPDGIRAHLVCLDTVGNKGDGRSLAHIAVLEGTPNWEELPKLAQQITNEFTGINRVLFVPGKTIDRSKIQGAHTEMSQAHALKLQRMEEIHRLAVEKDGLEAYLTQHFVASLGFDLHGTDLPTLALRFFITGDKLQQMVKRRGGDNPEDNMTGIAAIPGVNIDVVGFNDVMKELSDNLEGFSEVVYDLTTKPPGTCEYE